MSRTQACRVAPIQATHADSVTYQEASRLTGLSYLADAGPAALAAKLTEHALPWREARVSGLATG
jgi:hypothetical protein